MAQNYSPQIVRDGLVMCLDASQNKSYPTTDLPVKNGLLVWLDASDDSTFSYSSGTEVSQWRDKSGNNFHANQATVANQPSRNTVVNSRKSVNFNSTNGDRLRVNSGMVFTNSVTAIVFIKPGTQNFAYADILDQDHAMDGYNGWVIQRNNTASQWLVWLANEAGTTWLNTNAVSYVDNTPQIVTLRKGSSTLTLSSNGTSSGDVAIANEQIRQANYFGLNIGTWRAGNELYASPRHYNGEICEIVVYNRALSITELKQVHTYLGQKWGISNTDRSVIDLSGNEDNALFGNGTVANMPVYDVYNRGFKFDGSNDYMGVGTNATLQTNTISIGAFFKTINNGQSVQFIGGYGNTGALGYWLGMAGGPMVFSVGNGTTNRQLSTGITPNNDQIYYMVGTYDGTNQRVYVDGSLIFSSTTVSGNLSYTGLTNGFLLGQVQGLDANRHLTGDIYAMHVYNRALTGQEVVQNYEALKTRFTNTIVQQSLVLNLDASNPYSYAGAGSTWIDVSGNSYNGTLIGSPSYTINNSGGLIFDSVSKYATLPTSGLAFGTGQFTIEVWVYSTSAVTNNIIYASQSSNASGFIALYYPNGSGFALTDFNGSVRVTTTHQTSVSQNTWYHVVGIRNASNQYVVYVNGVASTTNNTSTLSITTSAPQIASNPATNTERFTGTISTLRMYNRALSAAEILQNYNAIKGRFGL